MTITNLFYKISYPAGYTNLPIVLVMHGWSQQASDFDQTSLDRMSNRTDGKLFIAAVGMRGRDGAAGSKDGSGRELFDIYDALGDIRTRYASVVDPNHAAVVGYSGGGGNALGMGCKFPDAFNVLVDHFGISDYGRDVTNGWYNEAATDPGTGVTYRADMNTQIGGNPSTVPDAYYARSSVDAIQQDFTQGRLYIFHDDQDDTVPVIHSQRIISKSMPNVVSSITTTTDSPRWLHALPTGTNPVQHTEDTWAPAISGKSISVWTIPASGSLQVIGYMITKRFEIWLGGTTRAAAGAGLNEVADVTYDTTVDQYTVTPLTGPTDVYVKQGAKSANATGITTATVLTVV